MLSIKDLKINKVYNNSDIMEAFGCSGQGGMRRSHKTNTLVLISKSTNDNLYGDKWIQEKLHYTGMGQTGDQSLDHMQNKTLSRSNENDITIHLFEVFKAKEYTYAGTVYLDGEPYQAEEYDVKGKLRKVYRFPLSLHSQAYNHGHNI